MDEIITTSGEEDEKRLTREAVLRRKTSQHSVSSSELFYP